MDDFFSRIDSVLSLPDLLTLTARYYNIGSVAQCSLIRTGYQECNVDLVTSSGRYVVKIFSKEKTFARIQDVMWGYQTFRKRGVPLPKLIGPLMEFPGNNRPSFLCVFEYVEGKPLTQTPVTDTDIVTITNAMGMMHNEPKIINRYYDTLAISNVVAEYKTKKDALFADEIVWIKPVISDLKKIHLASFPQSIIHGSLEKENILKNAHGGVCLLDLGCMDYNASVLDIATLIANFPKWRELILTTYQHERKLTPEEIKALPILIRAQFVAYILGMNYYFRKKHDRSKQTQIWLDRGWNGLKSYT